MLERKHTHNVEGLSFWVDFGYFFVVVGIVPEFIWDTLVTWIVMLVFN